MRLTRNVFFILFALFFSVSNLSAADVMVGGKAFYAFWDPYLKDIPKSFPLANSEGWQTLDTGGGWMYGPTASIRLFEDLSISVTYLMGTLQAKLDGAWSFQENPSNPVSNYVGSGYAEIDRQDVDAAISYNIGTSFKVFAGYKYQPLDMKIKQLKYEYYEDPSGNITLRIQNVDMTFKSTYNSPAFGVGYSVPFADIFAFTINLSGLYVNGKSEIERNQKGLYEVNLAAGGGVWNPTSSDNTFKADMEVNGWGYNIEPSLVTMLKENILFIVGLRYQTVNVEGTMKIKESGGGGAIPDVDMKDLNDTAYGVTFTALYKFDI